jgi:DNA-binding CsgD family transcriptional regulator
MVSGGFNTTRISMKSNVLAQSTYSNIVFFENLDQHWQYKYQLAGFNDLIRYIEVDHLNNLWASHMHRGVYRLKLNSKQDSILRTQYYGELVFGKDYDIQVFKVEGRIVFTTGEQIYTYSDLNDTIIPYTQLNSGLGEYAKAHRIIQGQDHNYWFVGANGIGLFRVLDFSTELIKEYPLGLFKDRLIEDYEFILPISAMEGLLCLENGYALLRADLPDLSFGIENKQLILKNIEISGRSGKVEKLALEGNVIRIPFNKNSMVLSFAFPYISSQPILFQSFVEGLEMDWGEAQEVPVFNYARIPYGEYRMRIRAFNEWNVRSQEVEITLMVSPPWYLKAASLFIYSILIILILLGGRYQLIRRIRIREQKNTESKEKELIRLRNEKLNAELSFKSQELANSTMAIIKKNEFLLKLKEIIKKQKEDLGSRFPEKYYAKLVGKIDKNISSMDDWNVFEIHFEKAHEKFLQTLSTKYPQLSHSDLRLCAYLRMNLTSKEIAPLLRISYRGVENHRYRLRKKLQMNKEMNLTDFILSV